eukprot:2756529-Amphidinium_carterae.1
MGDGMVGVDCWQSARINCTTCWKSSLVPWPMHSSHHTEPELQLGLLDFVTCRVAHGAGAAMRNSLCTSWHVGAVAWNFKPTSESWSWMFVDGLDFVS